MIAEMPYADLNSALDDPPGYRNYWSAEHLDSFPDPAVDAFCARASDMVVPSASQHVLFPMGGAGSRGPTDYPIPGAARTGSSTRSGCGPTRPTTSGQSAGPATCALTCIRGRPARSTSTSSATKAPSESSPGWGRTTTTDWPRSRPSTTRTTCSISTTTSCRSTLAGRGVSNASRDLCGVRGQFGWADRRRWEQGAAGWADLDCGAHLRATPQSKHGVHRQSSTSTSARASCQSSQSQSRSSPASVIQGRTSAYSRSRVVYQSRSTTSPASAVAAAVSGHRRSARSTRRSGRRPPRPRG